MSRIAALKKEAETKTAELFEDQKVSDIAAALKEATSTKGTTSEDKNRNLVRTSLRITARESS